MAASLSHTCKKDANKGASGLLFFVFCAFGSTIDSLQLLSQLKYLAVCASDPFSDLLCLLRNLSRNYS